jgi:hypothetical protein
LVNIQSVGRLIYELTGKDKPYEEYFSCHDIDYGFSPYHCEN